MDPVRKSIRLLGEEFRAFCRTNARCLPYVILCLPLLAIPSIALHPDAYTWVLVNAVKRLVKQCVFTVAQARHVLCEQVLTSYLVFFWISCVVASWLITQKFHTSILRQHEEESKKKETCVERYCEPPPLLPLNEMMLISNSNEEEEEEEKDQEEDDEEEEEEKEEKEEPLIFDESEPTDKVSSPLLPVVNEEPEKIEVESETDEDTDEEELISDNNAEISNPPVVCLKQEPQETVNEIISTAIEPPAPVVVTKTTLGPIRNPRCTPFELVSILRDPKCTDEQIHHLVASRRVTSALLAQMHPSDFMKAGVSDFVLSRLLSYVTRYTNPPAPVRPIHGPPPGFSGGPQYYQQVRQYQHVLESKTPNYEQDMREISNQMTMNVLD